MPELMTKQDAIEYLLYMKHDVHAKSPMDIALDTAIEALKHPTIEAEPVRHGRWIECDYKHIEHGMIETEPKAGLCCSYCRTAFQKKKMTYKQYCAACGARMDLTDTNVGGKGGADK